MAGRDVCILVSASSVCPFLRGSHSPGSKDFARRLGCDIPAVLWMPPLPTQGDRVSCWRASLQE